MKNTITENAMQICHILTFVREYCEVYDADTFIHNIGVCTANLEAWDLEVKVDEFEEEITLNFWSALETLKPVKAWIDIKKLTCKYDLDDFSSYDICNEGL